MFADNVRLVMFIGLLLFMFISGSISATLTAHDANEAANGGVNTGTCPGIQANSPDNLHYLTTNPGGKDLAAFYNGKPPQQTQSNSVSSSAEVTGFQPVQQQDIADKCITIKSCDRTAKYRTINGTCNNFRFPMWGVTASALVRLLPAKYQDGEHKVRKAVSGKELPNVRQLSSSLFVDKSVPDSLNMYNVMQWGQLVAHDVTHAVEQDSNLDCCKPQCTAHTDICLPIQYPQNDPFYSKFHKTCQTNSRSVTTTNLKCPLSPQQQVISVTHFLDASLVYGSIDKVADKLRSHKDGLLKVRPDDKREFPPQSDSAKTDCDNEGSDQICYATGDGRVNQNMGITLLQIIMFREHNRVARKLKELNPHWNDEKLYQEARKIVGAEVQRITYDAYLPTIIGKEIIKEFGLVDGHGDEPFVNAYNETLNPSTLNSFATGAYRAFHSMIPREIILYDEGFKPVKTLNIDDFYFRPSIIQKPDMFDKLLRGLAVQPAQSQDTYFSVAITNLFFKSNKPYGKDLESIDMQRGRDHGLAIYTDFRKACGLPHVAHFGELTSFMSQDAVKALESKYESVEDIDLFVGGMMENRAPGSLVGPTFSCIIAEQFKRWRDGDRFYYEFGDQAGSFTHAQLKEIRKITLAELFCRNGDAIEKMTVDVFRAPSDANPIKSCKDIEKMDLTPWKE